MARLNSEKTIKVMNTRDFVSDALMQLKHLEEMNGGRLPGRYVALARTALEEADHWLVDSLKAKEGQDA